MYKGPQGMSLAGNAPTAVAAATAAVAANPPTKKKWVECKLGSNPGRPPPKTIKN